MAQQLLETSCARLESQRIAQRVDRVIHVCTRHQVAVLRGTGGATSNTRGRGDATHSGGVGTRGGAASHYLASVRRIGSDDLALALHTARHIHLAYVPTYFMPSAPSEFIEAYTAYLCSLGMIGMPLRGPSRRTGDAHPPSGPTYMYSVVDGHMVVLAMEEEPSRIVCCLCAIHAPNTPPSDAFVRTCAAIRQQLLVCAFLYDLHLQHVQVSLRHALQVGCARETDGAEQSMVAAGEDVLCCLSQLLMRHPMPPHHSRAHVLHYTLHMEPGPIGEHNGDGTLGRNPTASHLMGYIAENPHRYDFHALRNDNITVPVVFFPSVLDNSTPKTLSQPAQTMYYAIVYADPPPSMVVNCFIVHTHRYLPRPWAPTPAKPNIEAAVAESSRRIQQQWREAGRDWLRDKLWRRLVLTRGSRAMEYPHFVLLRSMAHWQPLDEIDPSLGSLFRQPIPWKGFVKYVCEALTHRIHQYIGRTSIHLLVFNHNHKDLLIHFETKNSRAVAYSCRRAEDVDPSLLVAERKQIRLFVNVLLSYMTRITLLK